MLMDKYCPVSGCQKEMALFGGGQNAHMALDAISGKLIPCCSEEHAQVYESRQKNKKKELDRYLAEERRFPQYEQRADVALLVGLGLQ